MEKDQFREDNTLWEVLKVIHSKTHKQLVIYYFDVEMAKRQELTREQMMLESSERRSKKC
jgi:hypothetical protein